MVLSISLSGLTITNVKLQWMAGEINLQREGRSREVHSLATAFEVVV